MIYKPRYGGDGFYTLPSFSLSFSFFLFHFFIFQKSFVNSVVPLWDTEKSREIGIQSLFINENYVCNAKIQVKLLIF